MENIQNQEVNVEVNNVEVTENVEQQEQTENVEINIEEVHKQLDEREKTIKEANQTIEELRKELERSNLITTLAKEGLNEFQGLFDLETVDEKVAFLKEVKNKILVSKSYIPKEVAKQDEYTQAIDNKDVNKALGFKFSKLFGK